MAEPQQPDRTKGALRQTRQTQRMPTARCLKRTFSAAPNACAKAKTLSRRTLSRKFWSAGILAPAP